MKNGDGDDDVGRKKREGDGETEKERERVAPMAWIVIMAPRTTMVLASTAVKAPMAAVSDFR